MVKKLVILCIIIIILIIIGGILFYNFKYKKQDISYKAETEKEEFEETGIKGSKGIPLTEEENKTEETLTVGGAGGGSGGGGGGSSGGTSNGDTIGESGTDQTICQNAQTNELCKGLDLTYGQGYQTACCSEHSLCC
tara:strand:+ start:639 stop:1049 length:411 start_codon:yes stop_codon:yes gene_type:complete